MDPSTGTVRKVQCPLCDKRNDRWMVQCDNPICGRWYHLRCVGLTEKQAQQKLWYCVYCIERKNQQLQSTLIDFGELPSSTLPANRTVYFQASDVISNPARMDDIQSAMKDLSMVHTILNKPNLNVGQVDKQNVEYTNPRSICSSTSSRYSKKSLLKNKLDLLKRKEDVLNEKEKLIQDQLDVIKDVEDVEDADFNDCNVMKTTKCSPTKPTKIVDTKLRHDVPEYEPVINTPVKPLEQQFNTHSNDLYQINMQQWTARHALPKNLPIFTGKAEEWPTFISAYEHANAAAGYSNIENLPRLENSIKGVARDFVKNLFNSAENVPLIINTLRKMFGRPERILNVQLEELRKLPAPNQQRPESIMFFAVSVQNLWAAMKSADLSMYMNNPILMQELIDKLPQTMKMQWATQMNYSGNDIESFLMWLNQYTDKILMVNPTLNLTPKNAKIMDSKNDRSPKKHSRINTQVLVSPTTQSSKQTVSCPACKLSCQSLEACHNFKQLNLEEKWNILKANGICKQCLKKHYLKPPYRCGAGPRCEILKCKGGHHTLMHKDIKKDESKTVTTETNCTHRVNTAEELQFRYIPVTLRNGENVVNTYAFLDEGSTGTFLNEDIANELNVVGPKSSLCVRYTSDEYHSEPNSMRVSFTISGDDNSARRYVIDGVQTVRNLGLGTQTLVYSELSTRFSFLKGLPIKSYQKATPGILIGLNNWHIAIPLKIRMFSSKLPMAAKCKLGWTIFATKASTPHQRIHHCIYETMEESQPSNDEQLHDEVKNYFSVDSLGVRPPPNDIASQEYRHAFDIMKNTTRRVNCAIETGLLWKRNNTQLPDSKTMAIKRLQCLETRMSKDSVLSEAVKEQMQGYIQKGYLRKLSREELDEPHSRIWYLPIFPVYNPNKPGRVRMVFDAAASVNGISLNSMLLQGPELMTSLVGILLRFRQHKIAICSDIKDMFLRVKMKKEDQHCQRILWRNDMNQEPSVYVLQQLSFGATCSPSSAMYVKNFNANEFFEQYPRAVEAITENHYVDDFMDSVSTSEKAIELATQVKLINAKASFEMHQWKSNCPKVMVALGETSSQQVMNMNLESEKMEKVLGMYWLLQSDCFTYSLRFNKGNETVLRGERKPTKRDVLKILMSLYDPLGLLTHFTTYLKILLQDIWRSKVDWDEVIEEPHLRKWQIWIEALPSIEELKIPHCYINEFNDYEGLDVQFHIFVDGGKDSSAAVAFLRVQSESSIELSLMMGKSRVAPMKLISIPRLELIAALLGARMSKTIKETTRIQLSRIVFWSDSRTVLSWLRTDPRNIKGQFEQFKVAEIQDITRVMDWRYVPSRLNVADDATKWSNKLRLNVNDRWFKGPTFLYKHETEWPEDVTLGHSELQSVEVVTVHEVIPPIINYQYFSNWQRLVRAVANCQRYMKIFNVKSKKCTVSAPKDLSYFESHELQHAEDTVIRLIQMESFPKELQTLGKLETVKKNSNIYELSPYLDDGILKDGGRTNVVLSKSPYVQTHVFEEVPVNVTSPIILPGSHHATRLIVSMYHEKYLHINQETVVNEIRQKYHIPRLRQVLKSIRSKCSKCKILTAKPDPPRMADMPQARLSPYTQPFTYTGIDCLGPIEVAIGRRHEKRWVVLFTCLTVRAVHLEVVHGMDHDSFIMALRNFMQRRGEPREIFSDNGTNFVKAERILRESIKEIDMKKVAKEIVSPTVKWHFNPPEAPHMGGAWERLARSVKTAFYAMKPIRTMNDQMLNNYLVEIENMINSRPLTYIPLNHENEEAITPNHFLRGTSGGGKPIAIFSDEPMLLRSNWAMSQQYSQHFWKRWVLEYLPDLTRRTKWYTPTVPLKEDDIVLIVDEKAPRNYWQKGRIEQVNKGKDGQTRSAVVRTEKGLFTRPTVKLAKLDIIWSDLELQANCSRTGEESVKEKSVISRMK